MSYYICVQIQTDIERQWNFFIEWWILLFLILFWFMISVLARNFVFIIFFCFNICNLCVRCATPDRQTSQMHFKYNTATLNIILIHLWRSWFDSISILMFYFLFETTILLFFSLISYLDLQYCNVKQKENACGGISSNMAAATGDWNNILYWRILCIWYYKSSLERYELDRERNDLIKNWIKFLSSCNTETELVRQKCTSKCYCFLDSIIFFKFLMYIPLRVEEFPAA